MSLCPDVNAEEKLLPAGKRYCIRTKFANVQQQNNDAELLALIVALRIALSASSRFIKVHTNSNLLILYWSKGIVNKTVIDPRKLAYIIELTSLRQRSEAQGGKIVKISGKINPADLGFHK